MTNVFFNGWDNSIACEQNETKDTWYVSYWNTGATEPGSSGAPLLDNNSRVIGQVYGGNGYCNGYTYFGRFFASWTGGNTHDTQLSYWLDPGNTGASRLNGTYYTYISGPSPLCNTGSYYVNHLPPAATITWTKSSNINMISAQGSNPCTFQNNGTFTGWVQASITSSCGTFIPPLYNIWLGIPWISPSSTYTNKGSVYTLVPEAYLPSSLLDSSSISNGISPNTSTVNNACYLWYVTTTMQIQGQSSVTWSKSYSNPSNITWSQIGNDLKFYFWGLNQTATFTINASNICGSAINNAFDFAAINCGSGCTMDYTLSPNPASTTLTIVPNIPAPCGSVIINPQIQQVAVYDTQGNLKRTFTFGTGASQVQIDISSLNIGTYILDINDGTNSVRKTLMIQR